MGKYDGQTCLAIVFSHVGVLLNFSDCFWKSENFRFFLNFSVFFWKSEIFRIFQIFSENVVLYLNLDLNKNLKFSEFFWIFHFFSENLIFLDFFWIFRFFFWKSEIFRFFLNFSDFSENLKFSDFFWFFQIFSENLNFQIFFWKPDFFRFFQILLFFFLFFGFLFSGSWWWLVEGALCQFSHFSGCKLAFGSFYYLL